MVTSSSKSSHITPVQKKLHCLPIKYCVMFKTALVVNKFLHTGTPGYFALFLKSRY